MGDRLDQIVKGTPPPNAEVATIASRDPAPLWPAASSKSSQQYTPPEVLADPLSTLPSSPPQIYLNLLILETSLRSQYLTLRARRRKYTFFMLLLSVWVTYFFYALFLRPREDGRGVGGSVYWVVEAFEKVMLMIGIVTGLLTWGTGQWEQGVRWPRRWLGVANRGLRGMNTKIVIIRGSWWKEMLSHLSFLFPYSSFFPSPGSSYHYIEHSLEKRPSGPRHSYDEDEYGYEEDLAPGGDHIKLLLLPKSFSPGFRENWEEYRTDYWEKENERRARLHEKVRQRDRQRAREAGGLLWWSGWWKWMPAKSRPTHASDLEKSHHHHSSHRHHLERESKHRRSGLRSDSTHSRNSSRSTTPHTVDGDEKPLSDRSRRGSSAAGTGERRKKSKSGPTRPAISPLTQSESRPGTPNTPDCPRSFSRPGLAAGESFG